MRLGAGFVNRYRRVLGMLLGTTLFVLLALPAGASAHSPSSANLSKRAPSTHTPSTGTASTGTASTGTASTGTASTGTVSTGTLCASPTRPTIPTGPTNPANPANPTGCGTPVLPLAGTPPMGWDTWDAFGCGVTEQDVKQSANWLIATGMREAGYRYVIIDDCWYDPNRTANGSLRANPTTFPDGMRALGTWLHARGLLFGIYESPTAKTCAQGNNFYPGATGSLGHEQQDADTFASWGVDYLKYDYCSADGSLQDQIAAFTKMRNALRATGRPIVYSINPNSFHTPTGASYDWTQVANVVRTGPDLAPFWDTGSYQNWMVGVANAIAIDTPLALRAGPGHWNDPDSLAVGLTVQQYVTTTGATGLENLLTPPLGTADDALSLAEMQTNFTMWAMLAAPLIVEDQVRYLSPAAAHILLNPALIAIDQDPLGHQAVPISTGSPVWAKPLSDGSVAVALFNTTGVPAFMPAYARQFHLPAASSYTVTNLWTGKEWGGTGAFWANVPAHSAAVFRVAAVPKPPHRKSQPQHGGSQGSGKSQPQRGGSPGSGSGSPGSGGANVGTRTG